VKKPVSKFAFECNLQRYSAAFAPVTEMTEGFMSEARRDMVGLCTLNQVDP
jgi:hypothetical protein